MKERGVKELLSGLSGDSMMSSITKASLSPITPAGPFRAITHLFALLTRPVITPVPKQIILE